MQARSTIPEFLEISYSMFMDVGFIMLMNIMFGCD